MYTISFNGSGGGGGSSVLIQYQKTVDSSINTQMIVADYLLFGMYQKYH